MTDHMASPASTGLTVMTSEDRARAYDQVQLTKLLAQHDAARASAPRVRMLCTGGFTVVTDEEPDGFPVVRGQEFEISTFDMPRYVGRGYPLPPGVEPSDNFVKL
jgi:hypothetical protein